MAVMECLPCDSLVSSLEANARKAHTGCCGVCGSELTPPRMRKAPKTRLRLRIRKTWLPYSERFDVLWCVSTGRSREDGSEIRTTWYSRSGDAIGAASRGDWYRE